MIGQEPLRMPSVLVVDDDADIRETVAEILRDEGYEVETAANGAEALAVLRGMQPALILLDLAMPVMSGEELRAEMLREPALAAIPTVVMTAADRIREKTAGMNVAAALAKPVRMKELIETVARFV
jgi:CheY-like chemotaxis protein